MSKFVISCEWNEVPHLDDKMKQSLLQSYAPHEREARQKGIPALGSGKIYPIAEEDIVVKPFEIPVYFKKVFGFDPGQNRTAAIWGAIDPDTEVVYLYSEYYRSKAEFAIHAEGIKARGKWIPGVADWAGTTDDRRRIIDMYAEDHSLQIIPADKAVEAGIQKVWQYLSSGKLKVFSTLPNWIGEFRVYRRDELGRIVKKEDHLMDATRYLLMSGLDIAVSQSSIDDEQDEYYNSTDFHNGSDPITGY